MRVGALAPYERALRTGGPLGLIDSHGRHHPLDVGRWTGAVDEADESVLRRCRGPVLDVGCGPGRLIAALTGRDTRALGIDISAAAVRAARRRGARAVRHDLFDTAPAGPRGCDHAARWATVLLIDGNIGIGGDPGALLTRIAALLAPGGHVLVEAAGPHSATGPAEDEQLLDARFVDRAGYHAPTFGWAIVGPAAVVRHATAAGLAVTHSWTGHGRTFLCLTAA